MNKRREQTDSELAESSKDSFSELSAGTQWIGNRFLSQFKKTDFSVSSEEISSLYERLDFYDTTRNNLLTFSFATVLAAIGIDSGINSVSFPCWLYLIPYLLIIPFTARIVYYRIATAHISAFLLVFAPEHSNFKASALIVMEKRCGSLFGFISRLVNHEMSLLAAICSILFCCKYIASITAWTLPHYFVFIIPLALLGVVWAISNSTVSYYKILGRYLDQWKEEIIGKTAS